MRLHSILAAAAAAALLGSAMPVGAQWLNYPTPGIPRNADGTFNAKAPAPRTSDGKPDLTGLWGTRCKERDSGKEIWCAPDVSVQPEFGNVARNIPGGLPYQQWVKDAIKAKAERGGQDDPATHCLNQGPSRNFTGSMNRRLIQNKDMLVILSERNASWRQIWLDGRPLIKLDDIGITSWSGYSTGRWEGDTLIVESSGYNERIWLDRVGNPLTEKAHITEKFRRPTYGTLEVELIVDDPGAYTKTWSTKFPTLHFMADTDLLDYICAENEVSTKLFVQDPAQMKNEQK